MLGLAVGIDYALFILSRHRQNLGDGHGARARRPRRRPRTAGSAVVFAGMTVVIALVGLTVVNIPFLTVMGLAAAGTVDDRRADRDHAAARPARLRRGPRGPRQPRARLPPAAQAHRARADEHPLGALRHPPPAAGRCSSASPLLGAVALPALHMKLGLPDGGSKPTDVDRAPRLRPAHRGLRPGLQRPADRRRRRAEPAAAASRRSSPTSVVDGLEKVPGVAAVTPAAAERGRRPDDRLGHPDDEPGVRRDQGPRERCCATRPTSIREQTGIQAYVTGTTALNIDTADRLAAALPRYIAVVVGLALLLLMVVFRSILVPLKAAARLPAQHRAPRWASSSGSSRTATWPTCSASRSPARSSASCRSC